MRTKKQWELILVIVILAISGTGAQATFQRTSGFLNHYIRQDEQQILTDQSTSGFLNHYIRQDEQRILTGVASWYSKESPGIRETTANMEIFDDTALTCAMWDVPFNQMLRVTNLENGRSVVVRVNDRGPHRRFVEQGRVIDLSKRAFEEIAGLTQGLVAVKVEWM